MNKLISSLLLIMLCTGTSAQRADYRVVPLPQSVQTDTTKCFTLSSGMTIAYDAANPEVARTAMWLRQWVSDAAGLTLTLAPDDRHAAVTLALVPKGAAKGKARRKAAPVAEAPDGAEQSRYAISVGKEGIRLTAATAEGLFRAAQTLRKSLPIADSQTAWQAVECPYATVTDVPRFGYRGVHFDTARHYFGIDVIKQYIDLMAMHGCNQLHWHITDDQGWRFEVKAYPRLAREGSVRRQTVLGTNSSIYDGVPHGGFYTQEECREVVNYAAQRYINIIPEIDLPGHMMSALHVFPELGCTGGPYQVMERWGISDDVLCAGNDDVLTFLRTVLGEICDVFPSPYIHIGGDECPKVRWKNCAKCQAKGRQLGITAQEGRTVEAQLQTYINSQMEQFLAGRGRVIIGWDETLEGGLTENAIVMSWRGMNGGIEAARQHHRVIMSPTDYCYIDYYQTRSHWGAPLGIGGYVPCSKVYSLEPVPEALTADEQPYILGPQVNLWGEYVAYPEHVFYMLLPRLDAISEVQWTPAEAKDYDDFRQRLNHMLRLYDKAGITYCHTIE